MLKIPKISLLFFVLIIYSSIAFAVLNAIGVDTNRPWHSLNQMGISVTGDISFSDVFKIIENSDEALVGIGVTPGVSPLIKLDVDGNIRTKNGWFRTTGDYGLYSEGRGISFQPEINGNWRMKATGLQIEDIAGNVQGFLYHDNGKIGLKSMDGSVRISVDNVKTELLGDVFVSKLFDSEDTTKEYYIDPAGTSNINTLTVVGSASAREFLYSSDERLKTDIKPLLNPLNTVSELKGVSFKWKNDLNSNNIGFIAQDVEKVLPELVSESNGYKTVKYGNIIPILVEAIKEQQEEIDALKEIIYQDNPKSDICN